MTLARYFGITVLLWALTGGLVTGQELGKVPIDTLIADLSSGG
jgi:hypothetical protein